MLPYSVLQKSTVRIFRGHETDFTTKPGKNTIKKICFQVTSIVKFLIYSIFKIIEINRLKNEISSIWDLIESKLLCMDQIFFNFLWCTEH